jgi:hypothetical protein
VEENSPLKIFFDFLFGAFINLPLNKVYFYKKKNRRLALQKKTFF